MPPSACSAVRRSRRPRSSRHGDEARRAAAPCAHADNLVRYYRHIRDNDVYVVYAVVPPRLRAIRNSITGRTSGADLGRGARGRRRVGHLRHENAGDRRALPNDNLDRKQVIPLAPDQKKEAITCAVP